VAKPRTNKKITDCKQSEKAPKKQKIQQKNTPKKTTDHHHQNHTKSPFQNRSNAIGVGRGKEKGENGGKRSGARDRGGKR
jgi:hypothetical protein